MWLCIILIHAECQQQSISDQPLSINSLAKSDKQPAAEYSVCTDDDDSREVMNPTTPSQAQGSPVDQELPDYCNVDAINNMHVDGITVWIIFLWKLKH